MCDLDLRPLLLGRNCLPVDTVLSNDDLQWAFGAFVKGGTG